MKCGGKPGGGIDIGRRSLAFPVTPPCVRVRTRRFGWLDGRPMDARLSGGCFAGDDSVPPPVVFGASPRGSAVKASSLWIFGRLSSTSRTPY